MQIRRAALLSALSIACILAAIPASLAATRPVSALCAGRTGRAIGKCMGDALKQWVREQKAFIDQQALEHTAWHLRNDGKGVSTENNLAHRAFHALQQGDREAFMKTQSAEQAEFHEERTQAKQSSTIAKPSTRRRSSASLMEQGKKLCAAKLSISEEDYRSCMRPYTRAIHPRMIKRGVVR